jgi:hypothetical protein
LQWLFESTSKPKEQWFEEAGSYGGILNSLALLQERNVRLTILSSLRTSFAGQTLIFGSYIGIIRGNRITIKELTGHVKLTNWSLHICLTQQSWGALCIPITYTMQFVRIILVFKQQVCGLDILWIQDGDSLMSYLCNINGWSFVKNSR